MRFLSVSVALAVAGITATAHSQTAAPAGNPLDQLPLPAPLPSTAPRAPRMDLQTPQGAAAGKLDRSVTPTRIDIAGVNAVPFTEIAQRFSSFVGRQVTVAQLVTAANEATALYKERGHPLSFVFLPDQDFADGVVRVVAVEGYVANVRIEGDAGPAEPKVREIAERLTQERPLTQAGFERVTQLLTQLPGLTVEAAASMPATTNGATDLVLKIKRKPYNLSLGADLRRPTPRLVATGVWNDPIVAGSDLSASTLVGNFSREKLLALAYSQRIGADGLAFRANVTSYRGYPDELNGRGASIERFNTNRRVDLGLSYPLMLDARSSLTLSGGVYAVDNVDDYRVPASGAMLTEDTRVRALTAQLAYVEALPNRSRTASVLVAQGIDGVGASAQNYSNVAGLTQPGTARLDFTRIAIDASQRNRFDNQWGLAASFGGQYSGQSLAASERVSFGGQRFGRGYAAGDASGDSGWGVGFEVNRAFKLDSDWLKQVEPFVLVEAARVSNNLGLASPAKLRSVALGVRLSDARHYSLDMALAKPTGDAAASNPAKRSRLSLLLTYQLEAR